jgi:RNA polymerase sigma factor (TIGR02999 family)
MSARLPHPPDVTVLLSDIRSGDDAAGTRLFERVYETLHRMARQRVMKERAGVCSATTLVHECFLKLNGNGHMDWTDRAHFFGAAARAMRQVLVEIARHRKRGKRGAGKTPVPLDQVSEPAAAVTPLGSVDPLDLDDALRELEQIQPELARVVELHVLTGCTQEEIAGMLQLSRRAVQQYWRKARAWLHGRLAID